MKTAAKVFIIIGMVVGFWTILPLIFGGIALSQMSTRKPSTGICVCVLLFCNMIGGILLLCSDEADYRVQPVNNMMYGYPPQGYQPQNLPPQGYQQQNYPPQGYQQQNYQQNYQQQNNFQQNPQQNYQQQNNYPPQQF